MINDVCCPNFIQLEFSYLELRTSLSQAPLPRPLLLFPVSIRDQEGYLLQIQAVSFLLSVIARWT